MFTIPFAQPPEPTPVVWPSPTPLPAPGTPAIAIPDIAPQFVEGVEYGVNLYHSANSGGAIDAIIGLLLVIVIFLSIRSIVERLESL